MAETVVIDPRFNGPPDSGNGGYVCGLVATRIGTAAEVTLRRPVPLGEPLAIEAAGEGVTLRQGDALIAEGRPANPNIAVPAALDAAVAERAAKGFCSAADHPVSTCFVCGPDRVDGDGLRIFAGPAGEGEICAAPWLPAESLSDSAGHVDPVYLWAALDCPGSFALMDGRIRPYLLGRMTARISDRVRIGERCQVLAWPVDRSGRKQVAGTAVYGEDGRLCAAAQAIWFEVPSFA